MKISIVTVCYNGSATLDQAIKSVFAQSHRDWEHVIVDGGSTDGTKELVESHRAAYAGRLKFVSEPDKGIYDAMNKGVKLSTGEFIGILNSDDWYEPDALRYVNTAAEANPGIDVLYGLVRLISPDGGEEGVQRCSHRLLHEHTLCHQACFVNSAAYRRFGLFDISYRLCADYDFLLRVKEGAGSFLPIDAILANYRTDGASSNERLRETENIRIRQAHAHCSGAKAALLRLKVELKSCIRKVSRFISNAKTAN